MRTELHTARTCFSVLSVLVVFCTCLSVVTPFSLAQYVRVPQDESPARIIENMSSARLVAPGCSKPFCLLFDTSTDLGIFSSDADWNQTKPVRGFAVEWTVWPSGRSHSSHTVHRWKSELRGTIEACTFMIDYESVVRCVTKNIGFDSIVHDLNCVRLPSNAEIVFFFQLCDA